MKQKHTTPNTRKKANPAPFSTPQQHPDNPTQNNNTPNSLSPNGDNSPFLLPLLIEKHEVLQQLQICSRTLRNWQNKKALPFISVGNRVYFTQPDLQQFLYSHRVCKPPVQQEKKKKAR